MTPTNGNCFIVPELHDDLVSAGGIHLCKMAYRGLPSIGTVYALPKGEHEFNVGDRVKYDPTQSDIDKLSRPDGGKLAIVPVDAVLAILK